MNYYNEIDPKKAAWLRELISRNIISKGEVDERSIEDVQASDLKGFKQRHFFSGIGIWSYALRLAGVPDDFECDTGSCPCQPFSVAGKGEGTKDKRHLWPAWFRLITERRPGLVFGEQVADGDGITWLDLVQTQMESIQYRFGPCVLPASGFGAPHGRHRTYFVGDTEQTGLQGHAGNGDDRHEPGRNGEGSSGPIAAAGPSNGFWSNAEWIPCRGKIPGTIEWRAIKPGTFPLAHGSPERILRLRGFGDGIVAQVAANFIKAYLEIVTV